jgi:hypothetical protein
MSRWIKILIALMVLLPDVAVGAEEKKVEYGKYVCITDRAVGFQTPEHSTDRYAGTILMSPERQKFFATIRKVLKVDTPFGMLKDGFIEHYPERCFSKETIENLGRQWESEGYHYIGPDVENFMEWCLARSAVELTTGSVTTKYYSTGQNIFVDNFGNRFWMFNGWRFLWNFDNFAGDSYMIEGRCDLIK